MTQSQPATAKETKSFEALTPELSSWILDFTQSMNFERTTPVQSMAIPLLMGNKDLVVEVWNGFIHHPKLSYQLKLRMQAVTGSGKTLAFLIPLVERLLKADEPNKKGHVRSIVVAPTKELATQIFDVLKSLLEFHAPSATKLNPPESTSDEAEGSSTPEIPPGPYVMPQLLIGGRTKLAEDLVTFSELSSNVLVGTPKRLSEVLQSSRVILKRHVFDLLVLDEADKLLDPNFEPDLRRILDLVPKERRTGLFSASVSEAVNELVRVGLRNPWRISARVRSKSGALDKRTPEALKLFYMITKPTHKLPLLKRVLEESWAEKTIVYVSTRTGVDYWSRILGPFLSVSVFPLHGDHKAAIRSKNLARFKACTSPAVLLTTDVLARGLDIPEIDVVVQLDPPKLPKDFIHRCGRSGRAGKKGMALTFLIEGAEEDYVKYLEVRSTKLEEYPSPHEISDIEAKEAVEAIRQILLQKRELHDRGQKAFVSWIQAYTKMVPSDIFDIRRLDWAETGKAWGLLRWPKMPELRRYFPQAREDRRFGLEVDANFDLNDLKYADKVREGKRLDIMDAYARGEKVTLPSKAQGRAADLKRRKEQAWSGQKEAKAVREARRERKEVRRKADKVSKMSEGDRLQAMELDELIAKVRQQNVEADGDFEGFAD